MDLCLYLYATYGSFFFFAFFLADTDTEPTYGTLIDLFELVMRDHDSDKDVLCALFKDKYSHIEIGRPCHFYKTVERIYAPLRTSILGKPPLTDSELEDYRRRVWRPRVRNPAKGIFAF